MIRPHSIIATAAATSALFVAGCGHEAEPTPATQKVTPAQFDQEKHQQLIKEQAEAIAEDWRRSAEIQTVVEPALPGLGAVAVAFAQKHPDLARVYVGSTVDEVDEAQHPDILKLDINGKILEDITTASVTATYRRSGDSMAIDPSQIIAIELFNSVVAEDGDSTIGTVLSLSAPGSNSESVRNKDDDKWNALTNAWSSSEDQTLAGNVEVQGQRDALGASESDVPGVPVEIAAGIVADAPTFLDDVLLKIEESINQ